MKRWTRIYRIFLTVITVAAILYGSMIHLGGFRRGVSASWIPSGKAGDAVTTSLEPFTELEITSQNCNVVLQSGEEYKLVAETSKWDAFTWDQKDGVLQISEKYQRRFWDVLPFLRIQGSTITVTVPDEASLERAELDLDLGNVTLTGLTVKEMDADADLGNITASQCGFQTAALSCEMGNVKTDGCEFTSLDAGSEMGNVEIALPSPVEEYTMKLSTELGNIRIDGEKVSKTCTKSGSTQKTLTAKTEMGNVRIDGEK